MGNLRRLDGYDDLRPLIDTSDEDALDRLETTTLARLPAASGGTRARLVSCLLHGNEDSGYRAVLDLLRAEPRLDYDLWVLIGNVEAAAADGRFRHRYLDGQEDLNRVWDGSRRTRQRRVAAEALQALRETPLEAALDLHNTSGLNPPHAIVPEGSQGGEAVAAVCSDRVLCWRLGADTLMEALTPHCPAIAVECGVLGSPASAEVAAAALRRFLTAGEFSAQSAPVPTFEMRERVVVPPDVSFSFGALTDGVDLALVPGMDARNFETLPAGTRIGQARGGAVPLQAIDMAGRDVTDRTFAIDGDGAVVVARDTVPAMMTTTVEQARRDCLFYVVGRR